MDDSVLIEKITSNSVLQNAISDMASRTRALNLVRLDWKDELQSNELYRNYMQGKIRYSKGHYAKGEKIYVKNVIGMQNYFNIIVAGYWSFDIPNSSFNLLDDKTKSTTIVCRLCTPLLEIGKVMVDNQHKLHDNCKFFVETCIPSFCASCYRFMVQSSNMIPNDWCVLKTKLYNGEQIRPYYRKYMEDNFNTMIFSGILHLTISSRYTFGDDSLKIGGTCREMILFKDSSLVPMKDFTIDIPYFDNINTPSITLPSNGSIVEAIPEEH
ncbi:hypothetical protein AVEN_149170-1, partial [Araneus ventricosus]